jgi:oligoendopeptidase F
MSCSPDASFVPENLDAADWSQLDPLYTRLLERELKCQNCLANLILDRSELDAAVSEAEANLYIETTRHTDDAEVQAAFERFVQNVEPHLKKAAFELDRKIAECPHADALDQDRYGVLLRRLRTNVGLFREANVPIETELSLLDQKYARTCGAMTVEFEGEEKTLPQMSRYFELTDRATRESAWCTVANRRLQDRDAIDDIFDEMIAKRHQLALNAGFENFRDFQHRRMHRYDYEPADCERFHAAVEQHCVPVMRTSHAERRETLGLDALRPWDLGVDVHGRDPLRPFAGGDDLVDRTSRLYHRMDERLGAMFDELRTGDCLDLETRKGKAPGGYQYQRERSRKPFIFMNASGVQRDLVTMVHEAGHAFHSMVCREEPILTYRSAPMEFCEVASMSQELLCFPYLDEFYGPDEADRARRDQLEGLAKTLPWIATIDAFQHWIYTNPDHDRDVRRAKWVELEARFGGDVDWSGLEDVRASLWQRQLHLFGVPFYYIEYGIAQLGALQVWCNSLADEKGAIERYLDGLRLGGSKPLPTLFETAGGHFDFGPETVGPLMERVAGELAGMPA